jgi:hypothetical protein
MHALLLIEFAVLSTFYALVWHDKPARERNLARRATSHLFWKSEDYSERRAIEPRAFVPRSSKSSHLNWEMLVIWSFVVFSFAALFFAGYIIWGRCHSK